MTIRHRILRRLDRDTTAERTRTVTMKKYKVTHLNGDVQKFYAVGYNLKEGFAKFYVYSDEKPVTWSYDDEVPLLMGGDFYPKKVRLKTLEGIKEIEVCPDEYEEKHTLTYDKADEKIVDYQVQRI